MSTPSATIAKEQARANHSCRVCGEPFAKERMGQIVCGVKCALKLPVVNRKAEKAERQETKRRRDQLKSRRSWLKEAQNAFNAYIRARDAAKPCISCGRHHRGQYHAGHYLSVGARPELRFNEANCHKQCQPCNTRLHANLILYRLALLDKIGPAEVDRLEGPHAPAKWTIEQLKAIRDNYRAKARKAADGKVSPDDTKQHGSAAEIGVR